MTTGQMIKKVRQAAGMTQQELADRLGISYVGVSQWETDKRNPKQDTLVRIANALNVPVSYLCGPDRFIPNRELLRNVSEMLNQARNNREAARRSNDVESTIRWEQVAMDLERLKEQFTDAYSALPEDAEKLMELYDLLNSKGRKKVLDWLGDFCKIPEYQINLPESQKEPLQDAE